MKKIMTLLLVALSYAASAQGTDRCAKDSYKSVRITPAGVNLYKGPTAGYYVPVGRITFINDTTFIIPHPSIDDPCREVTDTVIDRYSVMLDAVHRRKSGDMMPGYCVAAATINGSPWQIYDIGPK